MTKAFIFFYLVALLVRPQDWVEPIIGLPTTILITLPLFVAGLVVYMRDRARFQVPHNWLLPVYVLFIFISTTVTNDSATGLEQAVLFLKRTLAFFPILWIINTPERASYAIKCYMLIIVFLAYQAILQAQTGYSWGGMTRMPGYVEIRVRWHGDWDGPNVYAILFLIGIAFAMEHLFGPYGVGMRLWALVVVSLSCVAIYFTNSRGAVMALMAMTAYYFKDRFSKPVAIGLAVAMISGVLLLGPSRMSEVNTKEESAAERSWLWEQGLTMLRHSPVFGVGRGQFAKRADLGLIAHNNYVQNFAETGLPGFFLFIALIWFSGKAGYLLAQVKTAVDPLAASFGRMMAGCLIGYCVVTFFVVMELELLYFVLALCMAIYSTYRAKLSELPLLAMTRGDALAVSGIMAAILTAIYLIAVKGIV